MHVVNKTEEEKARIAILKAGMQAMLEATKKGLRFRVVTEEVEPTVVHSNMND